MPTAANAGYYARIVAERAVLRRLVEAGTRIVQLGYGSAAGQGGDVDDIVDRAQAGDLRRHRAPDRARTIASSRTCCSRPWTRSRRSARRGGVMAGVPTGFADLDELTNGLHPGR